MTCDYFLDGLCTPTGPSREMRAHAAGCAHCRPLLDLDRALREGLREEDARAARIDMSVDLRRLVEAQREVRAPRAVSKRAGFPVGLVVALFGIVVTFGRRPGFERTATELLVVSTIGFLGMFALGLALVLVRTRSGCGPGRSAGTLFLAAAAVVYATLVMLALRWTPDGPCRPLQVWLAENVVPTFGVWVKHLPCPLLEICAGGSVLAASLWAGARTSAAAPRIAGAICGAAAAMSSAMMLFPFCASHAVFHSTCVHAIPVVALVVAGAVLGPGKLAP